MSLNWIYFGVYLSKKSKFHQIKANGFIKKTQLKAKISK